MADKDFVQYTKLKERTDQPNFAYVVLIERKYGSLEDYYLFKADEFENAYDVLKSEAAKDDGSLSRICEIGFNNSDRTYYLQPIFRIWHGKVIYDKYDEPLLHIMWYIKAGRWLNQREDI